jgi:hypothetical protein
MYNNEYVKDSSTSLLILSSFLFMSNMISTHYMGYFVYCVLFLCLTISSITYHYNSNTITKTIDRIFVISAILYAGYIFYQKANKHNVNKVIFVIMSFFTIVLFYCYGYYANEYCFDYDIRIGNIYHSFIHIISSIGFHTIMFM